MTSPRDISKWIERYAVLIPLVAGILMLTLFTLGVNNHMISKEGHSVWLASGFFLIPLAVQSVALFSLWIRKVNWAYYFFYLGVTGLCFGTCYSFWRCYFTVNPSHADALQNLSILSLIVISLLVAGVALMTYSIMRPSSNHFGGKFCSQLNDGVRSHPFWAITFFFTLFIGVAYLFAFSLAFHNKYSMKKVEDLSLNNASISKHQPALRMDDYKSIDDNVEKPHSEQDATPLGEFSFYFESGEAELRNAPCDKTELPERMFTSKDISNQSFNECHLKAIVKKIADETAKGRATKVTLIGHSDEKPVGQQPVKEKNESPVLRYVSNYELSAARAENVKYKILQRLPDNSKWHNIEWVIWPASNEFIEEIPIRLINQNKDELRGKFSKDDIETGISGAELKKALGNDVLQQVYKRLGEDRAKEENRVVLASVQPVSDHVASLTVNGMNHGSDARVLTLIDYLYFSIYTITTTGYGDIKPTTAYAKFVTSVANFCEVLFLVVFFNALISLKPTFDDRRRVQTSSRTNSPPAGEDTLDDHSSGRQVVAFPSK